MKANITDYKEKIYIIVDRIDNLSRLKRIYSFAKRLLEIQEKEKEDAD